MQAKRKRNDMPPRGMHRKKTAAINHGAQLPDDHIDLWYCVRGHVFFTVGPVVAYANVILCRDEPDALTLDERVRKVLCHCGFTWAHRLGMPKDLQQAARSTWRLEGEQGVHQLVGEWVATQHGRVLGLPYFKMVHEHEHGLRGLDFPRTSMIAGMRHSNRWHK